MKSKRTPQRESATTTKTHFKDFRGIDIFLSCVTVRQDGIRAVRYEGGVLDYIKPHQFADIGKMLLHTGVYMETSDDGKKVNKLEFIFRNDADGIHASTSVIQAVLMISAVIVLDMHQQPKLPAEYVKHLKKVDAWKP